jgi:hypothetical protein
MSAVGDALPRMGLLAAVAAVIVVLVVMRERRRGPDGTPRGHGPGERP